MTPIGIINTLSCISGHSKAPKNSANDSRHTLGKSVKRGHLLAQGFPQNSVAQLKMSAYSHFLKHS